MKDDLISREALKDEMNRPFWEKWEWEFICKSIDNAPTVETSRPHEESSQGEIKCPVNLNSFILEYPFENTFAGESCEMAKAYGDCYHCFASAIAKRDRAIRENAQPQGEWMWDEEWVESTTEHPAECSWSGWICSNCRQFPDEGDWDEPDTPPKFNFCPNCGARMQDMRGEKGE